MFDLHSEQTIAYKNANEKDNFLLSKTACIIKRDMLLYIRETPSPIYFHENDNHTK